MTLKKVEGFEWGGPVLILMGIAGLGAQFVHLTGEGENFQSLLFGVLIPSVLCVVLVVLGYWLLKSDLNQTVVTGWSVAGALVIASGSLLTILYQRSEGVVMSDQVFMLINGGIGGAMMGSVIGIYDARNRKTRKGLSSLHETTTELISSEDSDEIYELVVEIAANVLGLPNSVVYEFYEKENVLEPVVWTSDAEKLFEEITTVSDDSSGIREVFRNGELDIVSDVENGRYADSTSVKKEIILPLGKHGVLVMASTRNDTSMEEEFAKILGSNAEAALEKTEHEDLIREREDELRKQRNYLAALFDNTTDAIVRVETVDNDPIVRDVNPAFERVFGYEKEEIVGKSIDEVLVPEEEKDEARELTRRAKEGEVIEREVRRRTKDGVRDFLHRTVPYRPQVEGTEGYAVYTDITERKRRERRLEVLNRVLRHDIRNYINVVLGNTEILREDPDDKESVLDSIYENAYSISDLSNKARQIEKTLRKTERTEIDLKELVEKRSRRFEEVYSSIEEEININVEADSEENVVLASSFLHLVIDNILENSVEHNDKDVTEINIIFTEHDSEVEMRVSDNGPGIPEEEVEILERDQETDLRHTSGLGLWIVKWVVEESDGKVNIETSESGTVVRVRLPRSEPVTTEDAK